MRLLVLAGGFGTRLKTSIGDVPKALAPVGDVPFLQLQLEHWLSQGVQEFTFLLHHQADQIISFLQSESLRLLRNCITNWVIEPNPMDTGGAVANAVEELHLSGDFLVTNADTWLGSGISELIKSNSPSIGLVNVEDVSRYGQVQFDQNYKVISFNEKSNFLASGWINAGICKLSPSLFDVCHGLPFSLERKLFVELVQSGELNAVPLNSDFLDIGIPADYSRFCNWVASGRKGSV